jgi:hypothetical protein
LADTIEYRVKAVLEEKLSVILKEIGIDKYSDVLDGETAELNFTDAYMNSIRYPKNLDLHIRPVEEDLKKQVQNTLKVRDLIHEDKDLSSLVGVGSGFDLDTALRRMVTYYENSQGRPILALDNYSMNDSLIVKHLKKVIEHDQQEPLLRVKIHDFPNEPGYFMLWQLSLLTDSQSQRIMPIFINENFILRPVAGNKIWDALLDDELEITVSDGGQLAEAVASKLISASQEYAYDTFLQLKEELEKRNEETYRKYLYALKLRLEAAEQIGIENIKRHKLAALSEEQLEIEASYRRGKIICPEFRLMLLVNLE